ncbi:MAG: alpha-amylase [Elusimicrobia bacterium]|nr:alpha-amylase [Elusimicrobiota bacterium]
MTSMMPRRAVRSLLGALWLTTFLPGAKPSPASGERLAPPTAWPPGARPGGAVDWPDQVVYFLMTDRLDDGDPANDDQKRGEYNPADGGFYSGGDLAGIRRRLDYIQGLGMTAVWLTPPVANVWYDPVLKMTGYHGYWAEDFGRMDAHVGTMGAYAALSADLHRRGMSLIQDIVTNHVGDFFRYEGAHDPKEPAKNFRLKAGLVPPRPSQYPFSMNDAAKEDQRALAAYHWTPDIADFNDERQLATCQVSGLDDLNTSDPLVRRTLRESYGRWIKDAGVDGFRIDTARYVEHDFWNDFIHSTDTAAPGVEVLARGLGKPDFLTFGEVWTNVTPFSDKEDILTVGYLGSPAVPEMKAVLNFPLALELRAVFAKGAPPARLKYRLEALDRHYDGGRASVNFIDNHDMPRFLAEGGEPGLVQALAALFTLPGMPVVYAGTEQGFTETRAAMFAGGFGSGGKDHFDAEHRLYAAIKGLAALRRDHAAFRRGRLVPLYGAPGGAGPLAYRLDHEGGGALVLFNTADEEMLLAQLETGLPAGTLLEPLFARSIPSQPLRTGRKGRLLLRLPARAVLVLRAAPGGQVSEESVESGVMITRVAGGSPPADKGRVPARPGKGKGAPARAPRPASAQVTVEGSSAGVGEVSLIVDGRLAEPLKARKLAYERWVVEFDGASLPDGEHTLIARGATESGEVWSPVRGLKIDLPFVPSASVDDPVGDDKGPGGLYRYPLAEGFQGRADIAKVALSRRGSSAKLVIKMANGISDVWNPAFGFDHACFDVYIDFPESVMGRKGAAALPRLNASMKDGADWDFAAFLAGWKIGLYASAEATAAGFGPALPAAPKVSADKKEGSLEVVLDLRAFKGVRSFDGARFYVAAWDYDGVEGKLRPLAREPAEFSFGGGEPGGPLIMDDTALFP